MYHIRPLRMRILVKFNFHYVRKLPCKYELFWLTDSWEEDFQIIQSYFCNYLSFEEDLVGPSLDQTWIPLAKEWFVPSLIEIGWLVLSVYFQSFAIISLWRGVFPFIWTHFESPPPKDNLH
jgi:hypothetical protein